MGATQAGRLTSVRLFLRLGRSPCHDEQARGFPYSSGEIHVSMADLGIILDLESSSVVSRQPRLPADYPPMITTIRSHGSNIVQFGAETLLSTLEDPSSNRQFEFRVTATK